MVDATKVTGVGILGVGLYLPPEVRRNDWWPAPVVEQWMAARRAAPRPPLREDLSAGTKLVVAAMAEQAKDPFQGAVERHVISAEMSTLDMEEQAARTAIARSGIDPAKIDLLLTSTIVPDFLLSNPACGLHRRLGLSKECFSTHLDVATHAFLMQLTLAEGMIASGRAQFALIVQSCAPSRLLEPMDVIAPFFGDAATAVIVGPVGRAHGIEAAVNYTDGRFPKTLIAGVPGSTWHAEGRALIHIGDPAQTHGVFLETADACKESVDTALSRAGRSAADVDFFSIHQGTPWLRKVVQDYAGLVAARSVETFKDTGYLFASTIPAGLAVGEDRGLLKSGDLVVLSGGGPGMTYGATVMTWGVG